MNHLQIMLLMLLILLVLIIIVNHLTINKKITGAENTKNNEIMVPLKYLSNF